MFANGPEDQGSISGRVILKTQKMVLDAALLNNQHYKVSIKGQVEQSRERSRALPTPQCSSYWKGSLLVTFDESCQLYFTYLYNLSAQSKMKHKVIFRLELFFSLLYQLPYPVSPTIHWWEEEMISCLFQGH